MLTWLFWSSLLGEEHKMLLLLNWSKEKFNEKLGGGRKWTFLWINFQMTQSIWRVHILYISASFFKKRIFMFFSLRLNVPPFLSISFSSLSPVLQVNPCHKWMHMSHYKMQWEGWVISIKESPLFWNSMDPPIGLEGKPTWVAGGSC